MTRYTDHEEVLELGPQLIAGYFSLLCCELNQLTAHCWHGFKWREKPILFLVSEWIKLHQELAKEEYKIQKGKVRREKEARLTSFVISQTPYGTCSTQKRARMLRTSVVGHQACHCTLQTLLSTSAHLARNKLAAFPYWFASCSGAQSTAPTLFSLPHFLPMRVRVMVRVGVAKRNFLTSLCWATTVSRYLWTVSMIWVSTFGRRSTRVCRPNVLRKQHEEHNTHTTVMWRMDIIVFISNT